MTSGSSATGRQRFITVTRKALMTAQLVNGLFTTKPSNLQTTAVLANADSTVINPL
jgi:hypothetical protein